MLYDLHGASVSEKYEVTWSRWEREREIDRERDREMEDRLVSQ